MSTNQDDLIPVLSADIEITDFSKSNYVLSNKKHKHYLKISKEVKDLLSFIDNKKNIDEITHEYNSCFNTTIKSDFTYSLIYVKLSRYGLLENYGEIKTNGKPNYLKLSAIILNERKVGKIVKYFYFLFNLNTAFILLSFSLIISAWKLIYFLDTNKEFNIQVGLVSLILLTFVSAVFHEIGHATSTSLFGSKHGGIGAGFYLFSPVLYADVTDVWRLPKKKRIVVNLSGIYFEILFCAVLLLINLVLKSELLEMLALIVFIKTFFNLNPLVRSDGYWVITDLTNQPNLFRNAYQKVNNLFLFILRRRPITWNYVDFIVFIYGILSIAFISYFIIYAVILNPSSILYFPKNLLLFFQNIFTFNSAISIQKITELILPMIFFYFIFNLSKNAFKNILMMKKTK